MNNKIPVEKTYNKAKGTTPETSDGEITFSNYRIPTTDTSDWRERFDAEFESPWGNTTAVAVKAFIEKELERVPEKNFLETKTTEYKPHGKLTDDFEVKEKNYSTMEYDPPNPKLTDDFEVNNNTLVGCKTKCLHRADFKRCECSCHAEAPTDESWEIPLEQKFGGRLLVDSRFEQLKSFISSLLKKARSEYAQLNFENGYKEGKALIEQEREKAEQLLASTNLDNYRTALKAGKSDAYATVRKVIEGMKGGACSSGLCGHRNLEPNSVNHGEYVGRNAALTDILATLEADN